MNDDDPPTTSASASGSTVPPNQNASTTAAQLTARRKKNRENFNRRRGDLLDDLLRSLDMLIYAELSAVYYMDCSTPLLLLRALLQLLYLTPKSHLLPAPPKNSRFLALILAANALCIFLHVVRKAPAAVEGMDRGYLHGGLVLDFVGQKGPSSKILLVGLDFLVLGLQVLHVAGMKARKGLVNGKGQRVEDEERGVRRSEERERGEEVEMERLNVGGRRVEGADTEDETAALERTDAHIFDAFNSGQIVLADLDLRRTVREEWESMKEEDQEEDEAARRNRETRQRLIERVRGRVGFGRLRTADRGGEV